MFTTRFVILHHRLPASEHWDLMIEQPEALATWQLGRDPAAGCAEDVPTRRLPDHRKVYLEYEGPVSGDRGEVSRVEEGVCAVFRADEEAWRIDLRGRRLRGSFEITHPDGKGVFRRESDDNPG